MKAMDTILKAGAIASILATVAVGFGLTNGTLAVPYLGATINAVCGYGVIALGLVGVVGEIKKFF